MKVTCSIVDERRHCWDVLQMNLPSRLPERLDLIHSFGVEKQKL